MGHAPGIMALRCRLDRVLASLISVSCLWFVDTTINAAHSIAHVSCVF